MNTKTIELKNVYVKKFGNQILSNVNLSFNHNERIAIIGPNGSGKTTLLKVISGTLKPSKGYINNNFEIDNTKIEYKKKLEIKFQHEENSYPHNNTIKSLLKLNNINNDPSRNPIALWDLIEILELRPIMEKQITQLSYGEKTKLRILLSLTFESDIYLFDNFSVNLSNKTKKLLNKWILDYSIEKHKLLMFTSYDKQEILDLATRIIILREGEVYKDLYVDETFTMKELNKLLKETSNEFDKLDDNDFKISNLEEDFESEIKELFHNENLSELEIEKRSIEIEEQIKQNKKEFDKIYFDESNLKHFESKLSKNQKTNYKQHLNLDNVYYKFSSLLNPYLTKYIVQDEKNKDKINILNLTHKTKNNILYNEVNLSIDEGSRVSLFGNCGSGKTTLANILAGVIKPKFGFINYPFANSHFEIRKNVSLKVNEINYPHDYSVKNIVDFFINGNISNKSKYEVYIEAYKFGIYKYFSKKAINLSRGLKEQLAIFLSLMKNSRLLILDGYPNNLDWFTVEKIDKYINEYLDNDNRTLLLITNNYESALNLTNEFLIINEDKKINKLSTTDFEKTPTIHSLSRIVSEITDYPVEPYAKNLINTFMSIYANVEMNIHRYKKIDKKINKNILENSLTTKKTLTSFKNNEKHLEKLINFDFIDVNFSQRFYELNYSDNKKLSNLLLKQYFVTTRYNNYLWLFNNYKKNKNILKNTKFNNKLIYKNSIKAKRKDRKESE